MHFATRADIDETDEVKPRAGKDAVAWTPRRNSASPAGLQVDQRLRAREPQVRAAARTEHRAANQTLEMYRLIGLGRLVIGGQTEHVRTRIAPPTLGHRNCEQLPRIVDRDRLGRDRTQWL